MNEFKVGILALLTMAAVVYTSLQVTSNQSGFGEYQRLRTIISDASGIFPKTPIKVAGINAGRIEKIELNGNNALITFEVLTRVKIPKDSRLRIKTVGFLGDKYLEIVVGQSEDYLQDNEFLIAEEGGGMEALVKDAGEVLKDVKVIVKSVKDTLAPDGEQAPLKLILSDVKDITASLKDLIEGNKDQLDGIVDNLDRFTESLAYELNRAEDKSSIQEVQRILDNVKGLTGDLQTLVADIKKGKGTVGQLLVEEEIADEVKETLSGVKKLVSRVDAIRTELSVYTGANTRFGSDTDAMLRIFPSPERFYDLGIATSEFGPESEKVTTTLVNGTETTEVERVRVRDQYRFTVMIGRKIHNWSIRGGILESSGGIGVDYDIPSWGTKFTSEIFDYRDEIGPNLRFSTQFQVWNVVHTKVTLEDVLDDKRSATFSAGLKFTDEDLKGLIGFFF